MTHLEKFEKLALFGITLSVKTIHEDSFTGELFFYSPEAKILILKERIFESNKYNYRYLNTEYLTEYKILSIKDVSQIDFDLPELDFDEIIKKEQAISYTPSVGESEEDKAKYGKYLFEKLSSYSPVWKGKDIYFDAFQVTIKYPYTSGDVIGGDFAKTIKGQCESLLKKYANSMEYWDNPRYAENYRLKPWFVLTDEERSFVVHRAYQNRILTSEEVKPYLRQVRISNFTQVIFPLIAFPIFKRTVFQLASTSVFLRTSVAGSKFNQTALVGAAWLAWLNYNPIYTSLLQQKEDLLKTCEQRVGFNLLDLNDVLPRWLTCMEIHRRTQSLYNERNSILTGYLYPNEESAEPLVDLSSWPKRIRAKIVK